MIWSCILIQRVHCKQLFARVHHNEANSHLALEDEKEIPLQRSHRQHLHRTQCSAYQQAERKSHWPGDPGKPLVPGKPCSPLIPLKPGKPVLKLDSLS